MHRRLSTLIKSSGSRSENIGEPDIGNDTESKISTAVSTIRGDNAQPAPPSFKVKRVDYYYSWWTRSWKYRNTSAKTVFEHTPQGVTPATGKDGDDPWKDFLFVVVRTLPRPSGFGNVSVKIVVKSPYILQACKDVIQSWPGISWNVEPLELDPEIFLVFYDQFVTYRDELQSKKTPTQEETYIAKSVDVLINTLANDYKSTLAMFRRLTSHGEIQGDLIPFILVPRTIFVARCVITGQPRLFKLLHWIRTTLENRPVFELTFESVGLIDRAATQSVSIGRVSTTILIPTMRGIGKISTLDAYPIKYYCDETGLKEQGLKEMVIERGKKWFNHFGIHHVQYEGVAALRPGGNAVVQRHYVKSRIMVDRATFKRFNADYRFPPPIPQSAETDNNQPDAHNQLSNLVGGGVLQPPAPTSQVATASNGIVMESNREPYEKICMEDYTEEDYLLASTVVYGFSLADKIWLEFSISLISPVEWNGAAFTNLVLPPGRKELLKSLVETHHKQLNFDDFIKGKGHGLVVNLFGPPGVGKTFSAEATSEHVQRPLYVVGAADLGTNASKLDDALEGVFNLATAWNAIVLIDEADVFLEQRSIDNLERNAMVAVFLRHIEYYRGILFLTTNRVKTFDQAFLSRIHVALHFTDLSLESKVQVWKAFLRKVNALIGEGDLGGTITPEQVEELSKKDINGRQIKNAVRTAQSLATAQGQKLAYNHLSQTLDAMEEFNREFQKAIAA